MLSKSERTKQFIIEKSAPVFNEKGYAGTSLNDLIDATGLTKGSIYGNFENKDEVALASFDYNFQKVVHYIKHKIDKRTSIIDKLLVYPETYKNYLKLPFLRHGCPIANTSTEADDTHPELKEKAAHALHYWRSAVEHHLKRGMESGEIRGNINVTEFTGVMTALIQGATLHAKVSGKMHYLNASMKHLEKMIRDLEA